MRILSFVFETSLAFSEPVTDHSFVLRCLPKDSATQKVLSANLHTNPRVALDEQVDGFGNLLRLGYCPSAHDAFDFFATGLVMIDRTASDQAEPAQALYLQPSAYTQPSDAMRAFAREVDGAPRGVDAWARALALMNAVYRAFEYAPGTTDTATRAAEAFDLKRGVCQDFSHVLIALCRAQGIYARYANGLMEGEGATHAWVEVHDGLCWRGLDPTHNRPVDDAYLQFSTGRDFSDCPIERGVFRGDAQQKQTVNATVGFE